MYFVQYTIYIVHVQCTLYTAQDTPDRVNSKAYLLWSWVLQGLGSGTVHVTIVEAYYEEGKISC